jgi:peptide/nickel transport system permease protein
MQFNVLTRLATVMLRRLLHAAIILLGVLILDFLLLHLAPGDIAQVLAGENGSADPAYMQGLRARFGLDQPLLAQLLSYAWRVLNLDLGYSFRNNLPVTTLILQRLPATMLLMGSSLVIAVGGGIALGAIAARKLNSWLDDLISIVALLAYATPLFWIGLMFIVLFAVHLGWLPTGGFRTEGADLSGIAAIVDVLKHLVLPTITLALFYTAVYARLTRAAMADVLGLDFIRSARAAGLSERRIAWRGALPNAVLPVVTVIGMQVASLLGGAVLVETVFAWPGLGRLAFEAVTARDLNLLLGLLLFSALLVVGTNLIVDTIHAALDPRLRAE